MKKQQTLVEFWGLLSPKQRRLIHDVLRDTKSGYRSLPMGMLPFVPVRVIKNILLMNPMSPWSQHLWQEALSDAEWRDRHAGILMNNQYRRSLETDKREYAEIISIISPPAYQGPSHLEAQLVEWRMKYGTQS